MKIKIVLAILVLSLSSGLKAEGVSEVIEAAKVAHEEAKDVGFEWRDMAKMIIEAETAVKEGKEDKAIELANTVIMQSKAALKQAEVAKSAEPRFVAIKSADASTGITDEGQSQAESENSIESNSADDEKVSSESDSSEEDEDEEPDC